jgi:surfeit locus 1 family protein
VRTVERNPRRKEWVAVLLLAVVGLVCARLGLWQLHRADESRAIETEMAAAEAAAPLDGLPARVTEDLRYRRIEIEGRYVPDRQFLLDNAVVDGRPGYYVLTPFDPMDSERWIVVNRGWVAAAPDRSVLPQVPVGAEQRTISGRLAALPAPGLRLGKPAPVGANDPLPILSYPTMAELEQDLGQPLFGLELQLDPDRPDGFVRKWSAPSVMSPSRHLAYVGQWWSLAALAFGIAGFMALRWRIWRKR